MLFPSECRMPKGAQVEGPKAGVKRGYGWLTISPPARVLSPR